MQKLLIVLATLFLSPAIVLAVTNSFTITVTTTYTPLTLRFMSPTGNDGNSGVDAAHPWLTPNHAMNCGDVIIAAAGTYSAGQFGQSLWGAVSNCPSTTGGIDGTGGVYFATVLCGGSDVMSCKIDNTTLGGTAVWVSASNWAVSGFWASTKPDDSNCFLGNNNTGTALHHVAFINNIASVCGDAGFATSGGGSATGSFDQTAVVGVVAFNAANSHTGGNECGSAISIIPANGSDHSAGTHVYIAGAFLGYNTNTGLPPVQGGTTGCTPPGGTGHSDGEGIVLDTWGAGYTTTGYLYQGVIEQTVIWNSGGSGIQVFPQISSTPSQDKAQYFIFNNTLYSNNMDNTVGTQCRADLHFHGISPNVSPTTSSIYDARNNIVLATQTSCGGLGAFPVWAMNLDNEGVTTITTATTNITGNYIWNNHVPTANGYSNTNNNVYLDVDGNGTRDATFTLGTNTYSDPGLASPSTLWSTAPDCTGFENVTTCMLTGFGVYTKITPSNAPTTIGYIPPSTGCSTTTLSNGTTSFPSWLKGIVYLHWTGSIIQQRAGLITAPCGM